MHGSTSLAAGKTCANDWCKHSFEVTDDDLAFYDKVSPVFAGKKYLISPPTLCPKCRQQRRLAWRNERHLFKRNCDATQKPIITIYHPEEPVPVYDQEYWWSDNWDPKAYGRSFDFSRPFFGQFRDLQNVVPRIAMLSMANQNSEFVNLSSWNKDCYLLFESDNNQNCFYCDHTYLSHDTVDSSYSDHCQLCYECIYCMNCHSGRFLRHCENCSDCDFCTNCIGCKYCIGCVNLRNKEYCIFNKSMTKEEFFRNRKALGIASATTCKKIEEQCASLWQQSIHRQNEGHGNENCIGNYIWNSKNAYSCFDVRNIRDAVFVCNCENSRDCRDIDVYGGERGMELVYEGHSVGNGTFHSAFNTCLFEDAVNVYYSDFCHTSENLFGCISLRRSEYCILNKQYSKEEYETLIPKIIAHMQKNGEWGEFFPVNVSPFAYNETVAQEYFPVTAREALARSWRWRSQVDEPLKVEKSIPSAKLPDSIDDVPDDIINWAIVCDTTKRSFRIIRQELEFYRKMGLPIPRLHPDERYRLRMALRNPRTLWSRECAKCQKPIQTTYSPERPEIVYCEDCYLKEVY